MADDRRMGPKIAMVAAVAENRTIGDDGEIPWHYPADLAHFKQTTTGHPVIMGRRTYEGIADQLGGPLPERTNIVLSRSSMTLPAGAVHASGVQQAVDMAAEDAAQRGVDVVYVAGGESIYSDFLSRADQLVLTEVHRGVGGDTKFPAFDESNWAETRRDDRGEFSFVTYHRRTD